MNIDSQWLNQKEEIQTQYGCKGGFGFVGDIFGFGLQLWNAFRLDFIRVENWIRVIGSTNWFRSDIIQWYEPHSWKSGILQEYSWMNFYFQAESNLFIRRALRLSFPSWMTGSTKLKKYICFSFIKKIVLAGWWE